ncbi:hypothetical protein L1887_56880 [Cichorium endivia]|nr:hypothetical protein L1887_56880 [Cichorium endivia]
MDAVARQGRSGQSWAELDDVTELDVRKGEKPGQRRRRRRRRQGPSQSESGQLARGSLCVTEHPAQRGALRAKAKSQERVCGPGQSQISSSSRRCQTDVALACSAPARKRGVGTRSAGAMHLELPPALSAATSLGINAVSNRADSKGK